MKKNARTVENVYFLLFIMLLAIGGCAKEQSIKNELRTAPLMRGTLWWLSGDEIANKWQKEDFEKEIKHHREIGFDALWICNSENLMFDAIRNQEHGSDRDVLEMVYAIADEHDMHVIVDLPNVGRFGKVLKEDMVEKTKGHINQLYQRYGGHPAFFGWYLNYELNPVSPREVDKTEFWRYVWKNIVAECHRVAPGKFTTISPFFLLDKEELRGFNYLEPEVYELWWGETLAETGIDILMLQDSGEHLGFYTIEQREPFFAAFRNACQKAGTKFWINVETGETDTSNWDEYLTLERKAEALGKDKEPVHGMVPWRFTPIDRLEKKLNLAAKYGEKIINWGYYPFMTPNKKNSTEQQIHAYHDYKAYYERVIKNPEYAYLLQSEK